MLPMKKSLRAEMATATISEFELGLSSHIIAASDDLLTEILIRLPVKSLFSFKSVSKHWLSLITGTHFLHRKSQTLSNAISGLIVPWSPYVPEYDFVPLDDKETVTPAFKPLAFPQDPTGIQILQSCNGLLLCRSFLVQHGKCNYYIFNPTTRQFTTLPVPFHRAFRSRGRIRYEYVANLAFDPRKSPYYRVIYIYSSQKNPDCNYFEVEIYSSKTGLWRQIGDPFSADVLFGTAVYWNGAINWPSSWIDAADQGLYLNVDEERFGKVPMPAVPHGLERVPRWIKYFGKCNDHVHLIVIYGTRMTQFNVYEMDREYSGWFVKYQVDLEAVISVFPESIDTKFDPSAWRYHSFHILELVRRKNDEESYLVLRILGKVVGYNFAHRSVKKLYVLGPDKEFGFCAMPQLYYSFGFIESLVAV